MLDSQVHNQLKQPNALLESNSGTEPPAPPLTSDATPVESKVALQLTALQGIDYSSMASTVNPSQYQERDHHRMVRRTSVDTLYVIITTQVLLHMSVL